MSCHNILDSGSKYHIYEYILYDFFTLLKPYLIRLIKLKSETISDLSMQMTESVHSIRLVGKMHIEREKNCEGFERFLLFAETYNQMEGGFLLLCADKMLIELRAVKSLFISKQFGENYI